MNYTKGEWKIESFDRDDLGAWRLSANEQSIMRLSGFQTPTENKANAQLMASAPSLYEALEELMNFITSLPLYDSQLQAKRLKVTHIYLKALAKAEGK